MLFYKKGRFLIIIQLRIKNCIDQCFHVRIIIGKNIPLVTFMKYNFTIYEV